ncbi:hypothetical protein [Hymenobacter sp. CRA2]|uniref:hypothetical protein n=1 Tax=Hymenobacter sp. CRA2 TaxID=1955620 RepID=UPI00098F2BAE|nr:hypothetical protein [Hymenobacter sp. CRA2]OON69253.1 hypothetical protein B0919_08115 [Hymenobacter sp. CRA2]
MNLFDRATRTVAALALLGALTGSGCQSHEAVKVPLTITTHSTAEHRRIPGTHMLLAAPPEFKVDADKHMLRLDALQFVEVRELLGMTFDYYLGQLGRELATREDLPADALQRTTFNGHPAVFLTQPHGQLPGLESALLAFGDSSRVTLLFGVYPSLLPSARAMIQKTLLTASYDPKLRVADEDLAGRFQLDVQDTDFARVTRNGRWTVYVPGSSHAAAADSGHKTLFRVTVLPPDSNRTHVQDMALSLIREYRTYTQVDNVQEANTQRNGHYAYENVLTFRNTGKEGKALVLLMSTPQGIIVFDGRAYDQPLERMKQFVRVAKTIRVAAPAI